MVTLSILIITLVIGFIIKIQMHFHKLKEQHATNVSALQNKISNLLEVQKTLYQQVSIIDHFGENYKKSNEELANQIVALQYEFLQTISNNK